MSTQVLHYEKHEVSSDLPWLVMVHGAGGNIATWKRQSDFFKGKLNLIIIDMRDHGQSKGMEHPDWYSFHFIMKDLLLVLEDAGVQKAWWMGVSLGSILVRALGHFHPEKVEGVIVPGGIFLTDFRLGTLIRFARFLTPMLPYPVMYKLFAWFTMPKARHAVARRLIIRESGKLNQQEYNRWLTLYSEFNGLLRKMYDNPPKRTVYAIMGDEDYVFLKAALDYGKKWKDAKIDIISECGHVCNLDRPTEFNTLVWNFISAQQNRRTYHNVEVNTI
jgi:pimeloyl-ACP methyl ester carboxylesterase